MQMEVVTPQEFSCLAMDFPKFKGTLGERGITGVTAAWQPFYWKKQRGSSTAIEGWTINPSFL
jgi:hypothetical protein